LEEVNHSLDGGLYAELIRNRSMKENSSDPVHWSIVIENEAEAEIALDPANPLNNEIATSLKLTLLKASTRDRAGVAKLGFWGNPAGPSIRFSA
jgi:alpha-N-arabinofuranosidase